MLAPRMFRRLCSEIHTSMLSRKQLGQLLGVMSVAGHAQSCLFYITNRISVLNFQIGTSAEVSVIPLSHTNWKTQCNGPSLQVINNTTIPPYGTCLLTLNLGIFHTIRWVIIIADVSRAILGADFLKHYGFSVDMKLHCLLDPLTQLKVRRSASSVMSSLVLSLLPKHPKPNQVQTTLCQIHVWSKFSKLYSNSETMSLHSPIHSR